MGLLNRYDAVNDKLEELTSEEIHNFDECSWDIEGYYTCGTDDKDILRERVEALENLAEAIERVKNTEIVYA